MTVFLVCLAVGVLVGFTGQRLGWTTFESIALALLIGLALNLSGVLR